VIAPHATPAAAYAALGEFLTEDAPKLMSVSISNEYDTPVRGPSLITYTVKIHVPESVFPAWLEMHGFAAADVVRGEWTKENDVLRVTSHTGVEIFCLTDKPTEVPA
jgi:hypothetical protein